jgi:hypothetical protein
MIYIKQNSTDIVYNRQLLLALCVLFILIKWLHLRHYNASYNNHHFIGMPRGAYTSNIISELDYLNSAKEDRRCRLISSSAYNGFDEEETSDNPYKYYESEKFNIRNRKNRVMPMIEDGELTLAYTEFN